MAGTAPGQSTDQNYPTPVTSREISGSIKARDVGDSRLTSYFYQFDGDQGDLFLNIVARNFAGDVDVFTLNGLSPLTKVVIYADFGENETGRVIYLRKPEKMILRVQGRTPGDDVATFRIKFAGSFVPSTLSEAAGGPALPTLAPKNESGIRVNSVGTIVEIIPKSTPTPPSIETVSGDAEDRRSEETEKKKSEAAEEKRNDGRRAEPSAELPAKRIEVVVTDNIGATPEPKAPAIGAGSRTGNRRLRSRATPPAQARVETSPPRIPDPRLRRTSPKSTPEKPPNPLENVNLVIQFKDGTTIERRMSEVFRFSVDKGVLTVITKDGSIGRYSILDVAKLTIQ